VRKLLGPLIGLALAGVTLNYETNLFERAAAALDNGPALSSDQLRPPVDASSVLGKATSLFDALH
jgi:hypothetical protein